MKLHTDQKSGNKTGGLRATFRHNPPGHAKTYPKSNAILLISVAQQYHENEKFDATIDLINRSKFEKCSIMLGDAIQRHTMRLNNFDDEKVVHDLANKAGDEWIKRNEPFYKKLKMPCEVMRWDHWLNHPSYPEHRRTVDRLYKENELFRQGFIKTVNQFLDRYKRNFKEHVSYEKAFELCLEYLQEECAIIMPLWAEYSYKFIIYPGEILDAMQITYDELVKPHCAGENILHWLSLRFKRKISYKHSKIGIEK